MRAGIIAAAVAVALSWSISQAVAADGKAIYDKDCAACHNNMTPKITEKDKWKPRLQQGTDALVASVTKGKGSMPPKGGHAELTPDEIKAAVQYIESRVK